MSKFDYDSLTNYINETVVEPFYTLRLNKLNELSLRTLLKHKNPYLYKAKNITTAEGLIKDFVDAYLSSAEEANFGTYLEQLAVHICQTCFVGRKSAAEGIDLEFERDNIYYIVAIKSGPKWSNSSSLARMKDNFRKAKKSWAQIVLHGTLWR